MQALLSEQRQMNTALEDAVTRYKDLHNKTELGLRKHEDLLSKRDKQIQKIEKERADLALNEFAAQQVC